MADKRNDGFVNIPVYGSLAYDFETAPVYPEREREWEQPRRDERKVVIPAPPETREQVHTKTRVLPRQAISPFAIIGFACAAVLLVFTLMAKIQLTVVTDEAARLESQFEELNLAQSRLLIEHESAFNRTEIEEYATSVLGMQRPRPEQIFYLNSSAPDKAVVLEGNNDSSGLLDKIADMFGFLSEYF